MTQHHHRHPEFEKPRKKIHKDWRMWVALALMLAAITFYVLSLDDSLLSLAIETSLC
jgi:hypothetical protein